MKKCSILTTFCRKIIWKGINTVNVLVWCSKGCKGSDCVAWSCGTLLSVSNTTKWLVMLITRCHNSTQHSLNLYTTCLGINCRTLQQFRVVSLYDVHSLSFVKLKYFCTNNGYIVYNKIIIENVLFFLALVVHESFHSRVVARIRTEETLKGIVQLE